jgi:DNA-binding NtrC family response regulator
LINAIEYGFVMGDGPIFTEADLPPEVRGESPGYVDDGEPEHDLETAPPRELGPEEEKIMAALREARGNRQDAAAMLGYSRITLWRKLKAMGLDDETIVRRRRR